MNFGVTTKKLALKFCPTVYKIFTYETVKFAILQKF